MVCGCVFQVIDIIRVCIEILEKIVGIELFPDIMYPPVLTIQKKCGRCVGQVSAVHHARYQALGHWVPDQCFFPIVTTIAEHNS